LRRRRRIDAIAPPHFGPHIRISIDDRKVPMRIWIAAAAVIVLIGAGAVVRAHGAGGGVAQTWYEASRESAGLAPDPADEPGAVVQVYGARAWGWRGYFGVHTWIAVKPAEALSYTVYEVIGWRRYRSQSVVAIHTATPDRRWFGAFPELYADVRGAEAEALIPRIDAAARSYPFADRYTVWPGPNSNTFTAHVARSVPALSIDLPPTAIGKDFLNGTIIDRAPSGTGWQTSLFGLLGLMVAAEEGLEVNVLGLTFGIDPADLAIKLPGVGRIGPSGSRASDG
jgi:hypothetical protein